ncbi:MAG: ATP-binding protein [bacterium]
MPGPDGIPDGVVTASELYLYVREAVECASEARHAIQTPGLWPLPQHGRGEYLFHVPGRPPRLAEDPELCEEANPWRGLQPYASTDADVFFGREAEVEALTARVLATERPLLLVGASGIGKTSLLAAGLVARLTGVEAPWTVVGPEPVADDAVAWLRTAVERLGPPAERQLLIIDQLERIFLGRARESVEAFFAALAEIRTRPGLRIVLALRADHEPQLEGVAGSQEILENRFVFAALNGDGLRAVVRRAAESRVLFFEPPTLADALVDDAVALGGRALPLLSLTLSDLYLACARRGDGRRELRSSDYQAGGRLAGALARHAETRYLEADEPVQATVRDLMLRLVDVQKGLLAGRRVLVQDILPVDSHKRARTEALIDELVGARLLDRGLTEVPFRSNEAEVWRQSIRRFERFIVKAIYYYLTPKRWLSRILPQWLKNGIRDMEAAEVLDKHLDEIAPEAAPKFRPMVYLEPAHEAMLQGWERLQTWVREGGASMSLQNALERATAEWRASMLTAPLWDRDIRRKYVQIHRLTVSAPEAKFLEESAARARSRWLKLLPIGILLMVLGALLQHSAATHCGNPFSSASVGSAANTHPPESPQALREDLQAQVWRLIETRDSAVATALVSQFLLTEAELGEVLGVECGARAWPGYRDVVMAGVQAEAAPSCCERWSRTAAVRWSSRRSVPPDRPPGAISATWTPCRSGVRCTPFACGGRGIPRPSAEWLRLRGWAVGALLKAYDHLGG